MIKQIRALFIFAALLFGAAQASAAIPASEPIRLESTIVGDKEQPSISYFVPWQAVSAPGKLDRGIENGYDRSLSTIDREVLMRTKGIYEQMKLETKLIK